LRILSASATSKQRHDQHQPASTSINQHQPASCNINQHQPASTSINQHQPASTSINQHQPASTSINQHQPASTNIAGRTSVGVGEGPKYNMYRQHAASNTRFTLTKLQPPWSTLASSPQKLSPPPERAATTNVLVA
jgi:hypothetical protein